MDRLLRAIVAAFAGVVLVVGVRKIAERPADAAEAGAEAGDVEAPAEDGGTDATDIGVG